MRTGWWIISHRCSQMAVYVFCCNARVSFHSVYSKGLVQETLFVNCPSVICLPSMLFLCRDTTSELWTPVLIFSLLNNHNSTSVYFSAIYFLQTVLLPHNTVNPLCSAKPVRLTTSLNSWGKVFWLFVCRFPRCSDTGGGALPLSAYNTFRSDAFLLLVDNLGILIEGNLLLCSSCLPLGVPNSATTSTSRSGNTKHFSGAVAHMSGGPTPSSYLISMFFPRSIN